MNRIRAVLVALFCVVLFGNVCFADEESDKQRAFEIAWNNMSEEDQYNASLEYQAMSVGLDVKDFEFFARVVQAECDGTTDYNEGKLYVAACIWARYYSSNWSNTITGVLTASGQFTTVSGGWCSASLTQASRWAVIKGKEAILKGDIPKNMEYFNCVNYCHVAYMKVRDNYFSTSGSPTYFENAYEIRTEDGIEIREIHKMNVEEEMAYLLSKEVITDE